MSKDFNEITKETYDTVSENWETKRKYFWKPVINFLEEQNKDLKLLDLGCGTGRHLELAKKLEFRQENLSGCDYSEGQLKITKEKGFQTIFSDLTNLKIEDNSFDLIICIAAHHHLLTKEEQLKSLQEMNRILKNNGKILLSNWFPEKEFSKEQENKKKFEYVSKDKKKVKVTYTFEGKKYNRYYYLFDEKELLDLCQEAGFKILNKEYDKGNLYLTLENAHKQV